MLHIQLGTKLEFNITISEGQGESKKGNMRKYMSEGNSHYLNSKAKNMTRFKIKVTSQTSDFRYEAEVPGGVKGFVVSLINTSTYHSFVQQSNLL